MNNILNLSLVSQEPTIYKKFYSRYDASCYIGNYEFAKIIHSFGGFVEKLSWGAVGSINFFNGISWITINSPKSFEENDEWARKFEEAFNNEC